MSSPLSPPPRLSIRNLNKSYGKQPVLHNLNLTVEAGEFVVIVGPSGCGKSTLFRLICGLEEPTEGSIVLDGKPIAHLSPKDRDIAMVFQNYALYPHMSVYDNMAFGLKVRKVPKAERHAKVLAAAAQLQLTELLQRKPAELSGGQRQRVALGRAMVRHPKLFLMDEPLSNLDAALRQHMRQDLADLHRTLKATTLYVTHDQTEALTLAQRIVVLHQGVVQQIASPKTIYQHPANLFVARFLGQMNTLPWALAQQTGMLHQVALPPTWEALGENGWQLGFRPEQAEILPPHQAPTEPGLELPVTLKHQELLGANVHWQVQVAGPTEPVLLDVQVPLAQFNEGFAQASTPPETPLRLFIPQRVWHAFAQTEAAPRLAEES